MSTNDKPKGKMYRTLAGTYVHESHLLTQQKIDEWIGKSDYVGPERTWIEISFYCWWIEERGYIPQQARYERVLLNRTPEGRIELEKIDASLRKIEADNQAMIDNLFKRLMLPKGV
jgi:hypothetical protein